MDLLNYVWPGLAVWLAWIWVAIWQWILAKKAMEVMGKTPAMTTFYLTVTILGIALVESAVIYWLVVAFQLLAADGLSNKSGLIPAIVILCFTAGLGTPILSIDINFCKNSGIIGCNNEGGGGGGGGGGTPDCVE